MEKITGLIGRDELVKDVVREIKKGKHVVLTGPVGIGKSAVLQAALKVIEPHESEWRQFDRLADEADAPDDQTPAPAPASSGALVLVYLSDHQAKGQFVQMARRLIETGVLSPSSIDLAKELDELPPEQVEWTKIRRQVNRLSIRDLSSAIIPAIYGHAGQVLIAVDDMTRLTPTQQAFWLAVFDHAQVVTCASERKSGLRKLWWKMKEIEVPRLEAGHAKALVKEYTARKGVMIESPELYVGHVVKQAGGNPQAIYDMLDESSKERVVDKRQIREMRHQAGVRYVDFTPAMIIVGALVVATRYIAIGLGDKSLYILAGIGAALFLSVRFFMFKGRWQGQRMIAGTHIAFASALYLGGAALFEYEPTLIGWALASAASLGPDIDLPTSKAGRVFFWLSTRLERDFGHRTITHSLIALAVVTMLAGALYPIEPAWFWAIVGGYWSHIWIDMVNLRGADLLWPSPVRFVFPGNRNYRMETGSKAEMVLMTAMLAACLLLYPVSGLGFRVGLQQLLGNFDMAHDAFLKNAGSYWYTLKLEAVDNLTLEKVRCDCPVVGAWKEGLIVIHDGKPRAVGKSQLNHNLYPIHAELIRGEPLRVVSQRVNLRGRSLRWLTDSLDQAHTYYINGQVVVGRRTEPIEDLDLYRPATLTGKVLRLHYAKAEELAPHLDLVAAEGEVYVQYWLRPEDEAVEMTVSEEGEREVVPEALAGYL